MNGIILNENAFPEITETFEEEKYVILIKENFPERLDFINEGILKILLQYYSENKYYDEIIESFQYEENNIFYDDIIKECLNNKYYVNNLLNYISNNKLLKESIIDIKNIIPNKASNVIKEMDKWSSELIEILQ
jgi:hypothetical protein